MKKIITILAFALTVQSCTNENGARKTLSQEGYENIEFTGYRFFMCSEDDNFHTGFKATKNGSQVSGCVCEGILKGKTIRLD